MDPTRDPDPEVPKELPPDPDCTPSSVQTPEASTDHFSSPVSPGITQKASEQIHPPPPHHYFYYYPHIQQGEAKRSPPLNSETDDQDSESASFLLENLSQFSLNQDETKSFNEESAERIKLTLLSEEDDDEEVADVAANPRSLPPNLDSDPAPEQPPSPPPESNNHPHPYPYYPYYLHPYYYYYYLHLYQLYFEAQSLHNNPDHISPTPSKPAPDPLPHTTTSSPQHPTNQTPPPPSNAINDVRLHLYERFFPPYHPPEEFEDNQEPHSPPSRSDITRKDRSLPAAEGGFPSMHQPPQSLYSDYISQHHPCDSDGGEEERVDMMEDQYHADPYPPSFSPRGLGRVSDIDCSTSPGSCLYSVEVLEPIDCSMGEHLVFVLPVSALQDSEVLPALPLEEFYLLDDGDLYSFEHHLSTI
ncbi:uncharacterized protein LOC141809451 [Halichoeres trimaculatus]|uniref:uncharacterized protein LOC141809451 n=1 Tax=Halichoeres trimaculatus TaxID=147232 RepID=UPI003D9E963D